MSRVLEISDEQYEAIAQAASARGESVEALLAEWVEMLRARPTRPRYQETDDWLRHLGVSEEEIEASKRRVRDEAEIPYDADA